MKKILMTALIALCLSGCSTGFVYNNIDWLVHWYIDDYIDLTAEQKDAFDAAMQQWLMWHRSEELRAYQQHLHDLKKKVRNTPLTQTQWLQEFERGRRHWNRLLDQVSGDITRLAMELTDEQVRSLFEELEQRNQQKQQRQQSRGENWRAKKLEEDIVRWIGPLSAQQKTLVESYSQRLIPNFDDWMKYRRNWQSQARALLQQREDTAQWHQALARLLSHPQSFQHQRYREQSRHNQNVYASLLSALHASLSTSQHAHLEQEVEDLVRVITELMGE